MEIGRADTPLPAVPALAAVELYSSTLAELACRGSNPEEVTNQVGLFRSFKGGPPQFHVAPDPVAPNRLMRKFESGRVTGTVREGAAYVKALGGLVRTEGRPGGVYPHRRSGGLGV